MCPSCLQQGRVLRRQAPPGDAPATSAPLPRTGAASPEVPMTTEELQKILQTEGYIAHVDDDGDLTFRPRAAPFI